ncbi:vitamin B12 ABC transporter substrate-binding protein BtuF [Yersinia ruckeri]|uniref:Vitamin B12-binding protein n=2 Tax=Gammaproteobacteria TaxID=1236 RepID=A0A380QND7_YERRU|nr:vitamin B12 ABC transporter substrate-binding protein BtuF [Yersinia ruckeri]AUQ40888.1 vitamin B12 ABC transporter substrate-binding protein BtuF [Yersinia ruckeri]EKN4688951.1 vitamin B12 ABC transporter substrate-binding protein BtuF [Yersinia ruckeri]EKN4694533.1 vitamin B12 ABC transporter substrate-binding protein BtuF [Yersinia ruckeri]MCK8539720.1 vitamin B12 ABC transporter substrate-binding protein BtuF [Yersinia ruckeri]MCK8571736.1 vitamin B12 ABC transporter substrate-binding p
MKAGLILTSCRRLLLCGFLTLGIPISASAAERVISLAPSTTELAYAAGLGDKLVAVSDYSDYPEAAKKLEHVASWQGINVERILALKPDLILAWRGGNAQRPLDQLARFGIPIFYSDPDTIDQIADDLDRLAIHSPKPQQAHHTANYIRQQRDQLVQRYARTVPLRVFLQFGTQPLFTTSGHTLQSEVVSLCGGKNIFATSRVPWPQISREQVLSRQPDAIIIAGGSDQIKAVSAFWQPQLNVPIVAINEDWFNRAGPRILLAAHQLCQQLASVPSPVSESS